MNDFLALLTALTVSGSFLLFIVWLAEKCFGRHLSKGALYGLYLLVMASFLLPVPLGDVHFSLKSAQVPVRESFTVTEMPKSEAVLMGNNFVPTAKTVDEPSGVVSGTKVNGEVKVRVFFWLWLGGFGFSLVRLSYGYLRLKGRIKRSWQPYTAADAFGFRRIFQSKQVTSPLVMGLWRPMVVLPEGIDEDSACNALAHELVHIKRRDLWWKWLLQLTAALHWFNPLMYFLRKKWQKYCELSCDEQVIALMSAKEKQSYGETLLRLAAKGQKADLHLALGSDKQGVKERLVAIMDYRRPTRKRRLLAVLLGSLVVLLGLVIGACAQQKDYTTQTTEAANRWAEAFCGRNGQECYDLLSEKGKAVFYEQDWVQSTPEDDFYGIGWSSPWPMFERPFEVIKVDGLKATVVYWAKTSNPLVFVWVQQLTFVEEDGELYLDSYPITYGDSTMNGESFAEIYQYALPEYSQEAIEALQDYADQWGDSGYLTPELAAENYFFLTDGKSTVTTSEQGKVAVLYQWNDGSSVIIDMYQPLKQGQGGIWYFSGYHDLQVAGDENDAAQTLEGAKRWAEAFIQRDGESCYEQLSEKGKAVFYEQDWVASTPEDNYHAIGWSSPWPMWSEWGELYEVVQVDELKATVIYRAQTSVPTNAIWVQQLTFIEDNGNLFIEDYPLDCGDAIDSGKRFDAIYRYALPEFPQENLEILQSHVDAKKAELYADYLLPELAAENYFFLTDGKSTVTTSEQGKATVSYQWNDGSSVMIDMYQPLKQGQGGIWYFSGYHDLQVK